MFSDKKHSLTKCSLIKTFPLENVFFKIISLTQFHYELSKEHILREIARENNRCFVTDYYCAVVVIKNLPGHLGKVLKGLGENVLLHDHHLVDPEVLLEGQVCKGIKNVKIQSFPL